MVPVQSLPAKALYLLRTNVQVPFFLHVDSPIRETLARSFLSFPFFSSLSNPRSLVFSRRLPVSSISQLIASSSPRLLIISSTLPLSCVQQPLHPPTNCSSSLLPRLVEGRSPQPLVLTRSCRLLPRPGSSIYLHGPDYHGLNSRSKYITLTQPYVGVAFLHDYLNLETPSSDSILKKSS